MLDGGGGELDLTEERGELRWRLLEEPAAEGVGELAACPHLRFWAVRARWMSSCWGMGVGVGGVLERCCCCSLKTFMWLSFPGGPAS